MAFIKSLYPTYSDYLESFQTSDQLCNLSDFGELWWVFDCVEYIYAFKSVFYTTKILENVLSDFGKFQWKRLFRLNLDSTYLHKNINILKYILQYLYTSTQSY